MKIRNFQISDYNEIVALWISTGLTLKDVDGLDHIQEFISKTPDLFIVHESDGNLDGTVIGAFDGRRGWLYHLAVKPNAQKLGIGRTLMTEIEKRLKNRGASQINLLVEPGNSKVIGFYESIGYMGRPSTLFIKPTTKE